MRTASRRFYGSGGTHAKPNLGLKLSRRSPLSPRFYGRGDRRCCKQKGQVLDLTWVDERRSTDDLLPAESRGSLEVNLAAAPLHTDHLGLKQDVTADIEEILLR